MRFVFLIFSFILIACNPKTKDREKLERQASGITIYRDTWGIPHVYGKTDADAVFGIMYAQCEENFERVERNYISVLGRLSEIEGEDYLYEDLQSRLLYDTLEAIKDYQNSEPWMKLLLNAFADGINYFLIKHPRIKPKLIKTFQPWYPLLFTDGAYVSAHTGGAGITDMKAMYGNELDKASIQKASLTYPLGTFGSNAFAIAPSRSANGKALLYINPHVSFYFRTEAHINSDDGLNAYGAITWGQFFVYQGFNENCGWMHTSSLSDASDLFEESIHHVGKDIFYEFDDSLRKVTFRDQIFRIQKSGKMETVTVRTYYTHRGPVIGSRNGKWMSLRAKNRSYDALVQSWQRMKTKNFKQFKDNMQLRANSSTNTMYADKNGTIAYWHGNFIPVRNANFDYTRPLDGRTSATEWKGIHQLEDIVQLKDPSSGWLQNCNSSPFFATNGYDLNLIKYPSYMAPDGENFRSLRARQLLSATDSFTMEKLITIGYDRYLSAFDSMLPPLIHSYDNLSQKDSLYELLKQPVNVLRNWNKYSDTGSVATTLATEWAYRIFNLNYYPMTAEESSNHVMLFTGFVRSTPAEKQLQLLLDVIRELEKMYGNWSIPWGHIVRFQRLNGAAFPRFDDSRESVPVALASSLFGCLPAFESVYDSTYKTYGVAGNSFAAVVEFGEKVRAKSVTTAGQSFNPESKNFNDQVNLFLTGKFKDVYFYKNDVIKNSTRKYKLAN